MPAGLGVGDVMMDAVTVSERLRAMVPAVSVGVMAADLAAVGRDVEVLEKAGVGLLHFDVMDGCFCPSITAGPALVKAVRTSMLKDVHLMVQEPLDKLEGFVAAGADMLTVHVEACRHPHRVLQAIGQLAGKAGGRPLRGVALNPGTPLCVLEPLLGELDMVVLLAVNPGFGGQKFIASAGARMRKLRDMVAAVDRRIYVGLDGGITLENIGEAVATGADIIVTGSAVFEGGRTAENAGRMIEACRARVAGKSGLLITDRI